MSAWKKYMKIKYNVSLFQESTKKEKKKKKQSPHLITVNKWMPANAPSDWATCLEAASAPATRPAGCVARGGRRWALCLEDELDSDPRGTEKRVRHVVGTHSLPQLSFCLLLGPRRMFFKKNKKHLFFSYSWHTGLYYSCTTYWLDIYMPYKMIPPINLLKLALFADDIICIENLRKSTHTHTPSLSY